VQGSAWTLSLNETTLAPVVANPLPFNQTDWPLPRTAPYQNSLRTGLDWFTFVDQDTFFGGSGQPPANMDWPLPRGPVVSGRTWTLSLNQTTLAQIVPAPFSQSDWPLPRMALYPAQNRTWLDQLKLNLIGQDQFFGAPGQGPRYDWPLPKIAVRLQDYTWLNNLSQSTLAPFIAPMPFGLYDWPTPRARALLVDLHSYIQNSGLPDQIPSGPQQQIPPDIVPDVIRNFSLRDWRKWHRPEDERELRKLRLTSAVAEVIAEVAERQAQKLDLDEQQRFEELTRKLKLKGLEWQGRYLELLNIQRQQLIDEEIGRLMRQKQAEIQQREEEVILLLLTILS
jgi:hypothetical protein